jgi:catechol 2,3-dioxygenase-like lactoylglutathione lyase family enzyme
MVMSAPHEPNCIGVEIASRDPPRLAEFYAGALGFQCESSTLEKVVLRLGSSRLNLARASARGRQIPRDSRSHDRWFRHLAIVVRDLSRALERVRSHGGVLISAAPQTLPGWNPGSAGIEAVYFRDPEWHPLELIHFPADKGKALWHQPGDELFQGIDHTAVVVGSIARSVEFYRAAAGLVPASAVLNRGTEQEHLSQVAGASVHVVSLPGAGQMGLELLEYLQPTDGRETPEDTTPDDLWWSRTIVRRGNVEGSASEQLDPDRHGVLIL